MEEKMPSFIFILKGLVKSVMGADNTGQSSVTVVFLKVINMWGEVHFLHGCDPLADNFNTRDTEGSLRGERRKK